MTRQQQLAICKHLATHLKTTVRILPDGFEAFVAGKGWCKVDRRRYAKLLAGGKQ